MFLPRGITFVTWCLQC